MDLLQYQIILELELHPIKILLRSMKSMNKIKTTEPKVLWKLRCKLGEGTLWVKEHNLIYFVDIKKKKFFSLNIKNKKKKIYKVNKEIVFIDQIKKDIINIEKKSKILKIKKRKFIK